MLAWCVMCRLVERKAKIWLSYKDLRGVHCEDNLTLSGFLCINRFDKTLNLNGNNGIMTAFEFSVIRSR